MSEQTSYGQKKCTLKSEHVQIICPLFTVNGVPFPRGVALLTGTVDPVTDDGTIGDYYINSTSDSIFGPKTGGGWGSGISIGGTSLTLGPLSNSPNDNGATLSGSELQLQLADGTHPGALGAIGAQDIGGTKNFLEIITAPGLASFNDAFKIYLNGQSVFSAPGSGNTYLGRAGSGVAEGIGNTIAGEGAGSLIEEFAEYNTLFGQLAGNQMTNATYNTGIGKWALRTLTKGNSNVAVGAHALSDYLTDGECNVGLGNSALTNANSRYAVGVGCSAFIDCYNDGGSYSVGVGYEVGTLSSSAQKNTYLGYQAGRGATHLDNNVQIGYQAGSDGGGSNNVFIANSGGVADNSIKIGNGTHLSCHLGGVQNVLSAKNHKMMSMASDNQVALEEQYSSPAEVMTSSTSTINSSNLRGVTQATPGRMSGIRFSRNGRVCWCSIPAFTILTATGTTSKLTLIATTVPIAFRNLTYSSAGSIPFLSSSTMPIVAWAEVTPSGELYLTFGSALIAPYGTFDQDITFSYMV